MLVKSDPSLMLKDIMEVKTPNGTISIPGTFIVWNNGYMDNWFRYSGKEIDATYYEEDGIAKLKEIAQKLHAKLLGDEGEEY